MTLEEARDKLLNAGVAGPMRAGDFLTGLIALGVLKVDQPRSALDLLKSRLVAEYGYHPTSNGLKDFENALRECGLQVVAR